MSRARPPLARRLVAEALATFALVFAGCGAIVVNAERGDALGVVGVSIVFGLVIMARIYVVGPMAGAALGALAYQMVRGSSREVTEPLPEQRSET